MKPTRLYIKRHAATGMLYFGKTVKSNINQYHGSGKKRSQEVKDKLSVSFKNRSNESRKKAADAIRGRKRKPFSEETKRKMSEAKIKYYNDLRKGK